MLDFIYFTLAFLVAISVLIAVHEFGHFWVAKKLGVKVLRYSIGFGRPILRVVRGKDRTEYMISALPLGGYVQMLDEKDGPVKDEEKHRAFNHQPIWRRFAIVAAGPAFNFLFAILAFWLMFIIGTNALKPVIGDVAENSIAAKADFRSEHEIVAINSTPTPVWEVAMNQLLPAVVDRESISVTLRSPAGSESQHQLALDQIQGELDPDNLFELIGFKPWRPRVEPRVGQVLEGSPAELAGLQEGDRILAIDGRQINQFTDMSEYVRQRPGVELAFKISRGDAIRTVVITPRRIENDGREIGQIGIGPLDPGTIPDGMVVYYDHSVLGAIPKAVAQTGSMTVLTLKMLGKLFTGEVSVKNLSGPINIAKHAGLSASAGLNRFLNFLAIVSISLGILNLLPIPILDGGHLMFYVVEMVKGSPVSEETEMTGRMIGIFLLMMLMGLAFYNDIMRLAGN
ncbi:RIP metalloprotease RseP [Thiohalophilus sp.]|uniref:RIP metalloprotease RseP n=1 Tax=Thiohalophilus sp. TaxID=3028392 RepID=UPI002ACD70C8|nr:RIP metalloprotease RseP [Thiohalophilus sp.]MDZ7663180.1 RIP metalloprotease RseP [Thiohalophilus sp.]